jgi:hypothetical protein
MISLQFAASKALLRQIILLKNANLKPYSAKFGVVPKICFWANMLAWGADQQ